MSASHPIATELMQSGELSRCAISDLMRRSKQHHYSITSSAAVSKPGGTSRPSALAVCRLMTNSNLVDCKTGRSAGFAPLRHSFA